MIINYLKNLGYTFLILIISTIILTILNYTNILKTNALNIISIIFLFISIFIGSYLTGKKANKKGYIEGIKFGSIIMVIILLINLIIFKNKFHLISILYYLTIIFISMIGSIVGITKKNKN